jgi:chloramphenicol 3-O phosphotransferase
VATEVIVLNGGSSSGKTGIARCLQAILPEPWIRLGVDQFIEALPPSLLSAGSSGIEFGPSGEVVVGGEFRVAEAAWMAGVAAMVHAGARVILDDVFLEGAASQERTRSYLAGLEVLWAGVRCDASVAAGREIARGDRVGGMAESQAELAHRGVVYDVDVDTTHAEALECARIIAARVRRNASSQPG